MRPKKNKMTVGWREWCALPELNLPAIKAKIDTGARTSALHAFKVHPFEEDGTQYVRFNIHPIQRSDTIDLECVAELVDQRVITSSNGKKQTRYVIKTPMQMGENIWDVEITLTNRDIMAYRMLIGREALRKRTIVDPEKSFCTKRLSKQDSLSLYREAAKE
jgi:ribosomal protein S6--L-glutamate ligase